LHIHIHTEIEKVKGRIWNELVKKEDHLEILHKPQTTRKVENMKIIKCELCEFFLSIKLGFNNVY